MAVFNLFYSISFSELFKVSHCGFFFFPFFQDLLQKVVVKTEGYEVDLLEKLYARLCQSIYRHRKNHDKTALIQVWHVILKIDRFCLFLYCIDFFYVHYHTVHIVALHFNTGKQYDA